MRHQRQPEAQAGAVDAAAAVSVGDIVAEEEEASRSLEEEEGDAEGGGRGVPSLLSPLQKRVALAIAAVLVGLVFLLDRHGGRTASPQLTAPRPGVRVEETGGAGSSQVVVDEGRTVTGDGRFNDWELHLWEEELAEKQKLREQRTATAELSAVVSEAERRAIFVKRRKCVAADLVKYKLSYEQRDGLTSCEGRGAFGPTCFPNICTTRAYLPGDVYIRAERNLDDTLGFWLRSRMAMVQNQLRTADQEQPEIVEFEVNEPVRYKLNYKQSVIPNYLALAHTLGSGVISTAPLGLADPSHRWGQVNEKYFAPPATKCAAAIEWTDGTLSLQGELDGLRRRLLKKGGGRKKNASKPHSSQFHHEHLDAWGCLFANAAQLASEPPPPSKKKNRHPTEVPILGELTDGAADDEGDAARGIPASLPKHTTVPEPQPAPSWLGAGLAWREFLRLSSNSSALRDVWLPAQVAHFMWQPSAEVLSAVEAVSVLSNYSGPRYLGRTWRPGSAKEMEAQWVDPVDRFQYAWPLQPVVGVVAMGRDFGGECYGREYEAACKQWVSRVGGKTSMQEALQRYQQRLWKEGKNPAAVGTNSLISECFASGNKGEARRKAARRVAQRKCPIDRLATAVREMKAKYKAKIVHLVTDAPDIPHRLISAKHTKRKGNPLDGMKIRIYTLSGGPGTRPFDDTVGVELLRQSDMLVGMADHLELPLLLLIGRTGVVPPFISMDRPPLLQASQGSRTPGARCTAKSCALCGEEARQRMQSPPVPQEWAHHESGRDMSATYKKLQQLGAMNEEAKKYEVYISSDHELPADMLELMEEEELVALDHLRAPAEPLLVATKVAPTHLQATWAEPSSFGSPIRRYEAKLSIAPGPECPAADYDSGRCVVVDTALTAPVFEIEHVAEGHTYLLRVRAENEAGWGNFSAPLRMTTPASLPTSPPGLPILVEMFDYSESCSAALKWDLPAEDHGMAASEYEVETRVYGGPIHSVRSSKRTMGAVDHLPKATRFLVRVRARNQVGWSEYGEALSFWSCST